MTNQRGFTLLEIFFALGIMVLGVYLISEGVNQMDVSSRESRLLSSTERTINVIADNIRTGLASYQITYDTNPSAIEKALDVSTLPMAWGPGTVISVADCTAAGGCPTGRFGYVITPAPNTMGLYTVTLRMTNSEWKDPYRDYTFLATVQ
jgi:type II secretory pathway pseudopilin PulG